MHNQYSLLVFSKSIYHIYAMSTLTEFTINTYECFPGKDVGIETEPALSDIQPAMDENVTLKSTRII